MLRDAGEMRILLFQQIGIVPWAEFGAMKFLIGWYVALMKIIEFHITHGNGSMNQLQLMEYDGIPICSMYGIFTYIWAIFGVNAGNYTIHGAFGIHCAKKLHVSWRSQR